MDAVRADHMGMLGTVMNCIVMQDAYPRGAAAEVFSALPVPGVCRGYRRDAADEALNDRAWPFSAAGWAPLLHHGYRGGAAGGGAVGGRAAAGQNVDGVYTADPNKDPRAVKIDDISYQEAIDRGLQVMDLSAFKLCADQDCPGCGCSALTSRRIFSACWRAKPWARCCIHKGAQP